MSTNCIDEWNEQAYSYFLELYDKLQEIVSGNLIQSSFQARNSCSNISNFKLLLSECINLTYNSISTFRLDSFRISFNGGKDSIIILAIFCAVLANYYREKKILIKKKPKSIFFDSNEEFDEIIEFVQKIKIKFDLDLFIINDKYSRQSLENYILNQRTASDQKNDNNLLASEFQERVKLQKLLVFVNGTRLTDQDGAEGLMFSSYNNLYFLRLHPIYKFSYGDVWLFFNITDCPYCPLYDKGYTSIGTKSNSTKNVFLKNEKGIYKTAAELDSKFWDSERTSRS